MGRYFSGSPCFSHELNTRDLFSLFSRLLWNTVPSILSNITRFLCSWWWGNYICKCKLSKASLVSYPDKCEFWYHFGAIWLLTKMEFTVIADDRLYVSMTQLSSHTFAHLTGSSFRLKAKLLPNKKILGLKYNWVNSVKKWPSF